MTEDTWFAAIIGASLLTGLAILAICLTAASFHEDNSKVDIVRATIGCRAEKQ